MSRKIPEELREDWLALPDEERESEFAEAYARYRYEERIEPRAVKAWYDEERNLVMFELKNGCVFGFPPRREDGLGDATPQQLAQVDPDFWKGEALHWEELDADISVPGVVFELLNVRAWYAKWLGSATSEAKAAAARENGKKGGRPRKHAPAPKQSRRSGRATGGD
ncbi:MAG TPA: DUF2442 domain-containing protein [Longimicrobium sp.]|nr:DUF2442 domain-containing protein [Longimicrobium sp.]